MHHLGSGYQAQEQRRVGTKTMPSPPVTSGGKMDVLLYKVLRTIISAVLLYVRGLVRLQNPPQMMWTMTATGSAKKKKKGLQRFENMHVVTAA